MYLELKLKPFFLEMHGNTGHFKRKRKHIIKKQRKDDDQREVTMQDGARMIRIRILNQYILV